MRDRGVCAPRSSRSRSLQIDRCRARSTGGSRRRGRPARSHPMADVLAEATRVVVEEGTAVRFGKEVGSGCEAGRFPRPPASLRLLASARINGS